MSTPPPYGPDPSSPAPGARRGEGDAAPWSDSPTQSMRTEGDATTVVPAQRTAPQQPTVAVPVSRDEWQQTTAEPGTGSYWQGGGPEERRSAEPAQTGEPTIFPEGVYAEPPSRAGAHLWSVLITLVLAPIAWFLVNDGSARIYWSLRSDVDALNVAGLAGLAAGLLVATIVLLTARWSSIGAALAGLVAFLAGLAFLVVPNRAFDVLGGWERSLRQFGGFGENLYAYLVEAGLRAQLLVAGFVLLMVAVVSHGARRKGRREEYARLAVRAARGSNPFA